MTDGMILSARECFVITPGASPFAKRARMIFVGGAGNLTLTDGKGNSVTFTGVAAGTLLPVEAIAVTAATATNLVGLV